VQVNRPLLDEFATILAREEWDFALLQEAPPRWFEPLCTRLSVSGAIALTSRNLGSPLRRFVAVRNPDLIASNEGGSNQILVRAPWRIATVRRLTLARLPERRRALLARVERDGAPSFAVVNLHASANRPRAAARELLRAAEWAGPGPLVFGGDFNLRPAEDPTTYGELVHRFGLSEPTGPTAIDHLMGRELELLEAPERLTPERRELRDSSGLVLRLSDHAPVAAGFACPATRSSPPASP
jgi:endonuclease/exonuclease/phosphatase family metal-dependent hydrolase